MGFFNATLRQLVEAADHMASTANIFQNKSSFLVKVLTVPEHYSGPLLDETKTADANDEMDTKYWFVGRILDPKMAHRKFLPDPCDLSIASDISQVRKLACLHTRIILSTRNQKPDFSVNDYVIASAEPGTNGCLYDLQYMSYERTEDKFSADLNASEAASCTSLAAIDWGSATLGPGTGDPTAKPCGPDELCTGRVVASYYTEDTRGANDIRMIVIHATAGGAGHGRAKRGAQWMADDPQCVKADGSTGPCNSSAHYFVDQGGEVWEAVPPESQAWHGSGTNPYSIGIEHTGTSKSATEWTETLYKTSAKLVAGLAAKFNIPLVHITDSDGSGIIAHSDIPQTVMHHDPGEFWDWDKYMKYVEEAAKTGEYSPNNQNLVAEFDNSQDEFNEADDLEA